MEAMIKMLGEQAAILLQNGCMDDLFTQCESEDDKKLMLAIASIYAIAKANA